MTLLTGTSLGPYEIVAPAGTVKVLDFGLAKLSAQATTEDVPL
jgi:hypothetical protein